MTEDTCWHTPEVVNEMNRFYDAHFKNMEVMKHLNAFTQLLSAADEKNCPLLDIGCGTAMLSEFCKENTYIGADLPHIIAGCGMRNYPQHYYKSCDIEKDDLSWISEYKIISINAIIDIMEHPLEMLGKILKHSSKFVIIHRQEITEAGITRSAQNPSYNSYTWHSIINRNDFLKALDENDFSIQKELSPGFANWENGGSSFLIRKRTSWALDKMDYALNKIFNGKENGFFIEAGANDGRRQNNTQYLEFYKNWRGILIEPLPREFAECKNNRSRASIYENCALVADESTKEIEMRYFPECYGLLSIVNEEKYFGNIVHAMEAGEPIKVKTRTLNAILEEHKERIQQIDLLVLDVEGYELEAIKGIDFNKWNITYLLIEEREENDIIRNYLSEWYEKIGKISEKDYLYIRK